jgi:hypothetical protein
VSTTSGVTGFAAHPEQANTSFTISVLWRD